MRLAQTARKWFKRIFNRTYSERRGIMSRYTVTVPQGFVSKAQKDKIVSTIAEVHQKVVNSPAEKLQIIVGEVEPGCFFSHGRLMECEHIFLHGFIPLDRDRDVKSVLVQQIVAGIAAAAESDPEAVVVYMTEMSADEMLEFERLHSAT
jgi:phenylpyruvate tautomerase PptA (4-oxalocrotonate tautomerase family)